MCLFWQEPCLYNSVPKFSVRNLISYWQKKKKHPVLLHEIRVNRNVKLRLSLLSRLHIDLFFSTCVKLNNLLIRQIGKNLWGNIQQAL